MQIISTLLTVIFVLASLLLVLVIMMQSGRSSGMGVLGGGGSDSAFGARSADVLTRFTSILIAVFMITAFSLAFIKSRQSGVDALQKKFTEPQGMGEALETPEPINGSDMAIPGTENPIEAEKATENQ